MSSHRELAEKYSVPTTFGFRSETRESQYDLLWLKCVLYLEMSIDSERIAAQFGKLLRPHTD